MGWESDKSETSKKIDATTDVLIRMETDKLYCELVMLLYKMDTDRLLAVKYSLDSLKLFSSPGSVERCIRNAISMCWMQEKNKTIDYIFANMKGRPPTNSQFLTQMYYHIQRCRN